MSSGEELDVLPRSKKRRTPRACDFCRRRKIRCNSSQLPDNHCSNCIEFGVECTHNEVTKRRAPVKSYVESLEQRLAKMEKLLHELSPERDFTQELDDSFFSSGAERPSALQHLAPVPPVVKIFDKTSTVGKSEDDEMNTLTKKLQELPFMGMKNRFFGQGSTFMFVQTALDHKKEFTGQENPQGAPFSTRRPEFWTLRPWELQAIEEQQSQYTFPEPDLLYSLFDLYFKNENIFMPLLHRPTFEKLVESGLHTRDYMFGATVLLVCAIGARHSDDSRVCVDGSDAPSAGWKWYRQVDLLRNKSFLLAPSLYELQAYCLLISWLQGSSTPQVQWPMLGMALRLAVDIGAHRRNPFDSSWTARDELTKRAFWVLVSHDRGASTFTGRPRAIQDDDFDLDYPIECDDEYWENEDPEKAWKQPPDKPSVVSYFNSFLKLSEVLGHLLRTVYSIGKSKTFSGMVGEQQIVAELDSSLNKWIDSVPDHLRWDPHREHHLFFQQSAALFTHYYHIQILIHRPFISSPSKPSKLTFPSLAICTNAARSCCHVTEIASHRGPITFGPMQMAIFAASIVLLINIWGGTQAGIVTDAKREMTQVHKSMRILRAVEVRFFPAGRFWDILYELAYVGNLPLPRSSPPTRNKRGRESDDLDSKASTYDSPSSHTTASTDPQPSSSSNRLPSEDSARNSARDFTLPMYTNELGRLPLHGQFNFFSRSNVLSSGQSEFSVDPTSISDDRRFVTTSNNPALEMGNDTSLFNVTSPVSSTAFETSTIGDPLTFLDTSPSHPGSVDHLWSTNFDLSTSMPTSVLYDAYAMWSTAPTTFGLNDWGTYISNVSVDPTPGRFSLQPPWGSDAE